MRWRGHTSAGEETPVGPSGRSCWWQWSLLSRLAPCHPPPFISASPSLRLPSTTFFSLVLIISYCFTSRVGGDACVSSTPVMTLLFHCVPPRLPLLSTAWCSLSSLSFSLSVSFSSVLNYLRIPPSVFCPWR